jgi:4-hydroxy-tetrahydrodipicolinate reductase
LLTGKITVAVAGFRGRTGREVVAALEAAPDIEYVGGIGRGDDLGAFLISRRPRILVDFTRPQVGLANALAAVEAGVMPIVGTSGLSDPDVNRLSAACERAGLGGMVAPNFALGAALMIWLAEKAAPHFEAAEVIEMHHAGKVDAPSATALSTAARLEKAASNLGQVSIHSVRLPGLVADQEVVFGLSGQTLSIAHRTTSRAAFAPGVLLAVRELTANPRFCRSLDEILNLS